MTREERLREALIDRENETDKLIKAEEVKTTTARLDAERMRGALKLCLPYIPRDVWRFTDRAATVVLERDVMNSDWDRVEPTARTKAVAALAPRGEGRKT
jgi:hypothetical protein